MALAFCFHHADVDGDSGTRLTATPDFRACYCRRSGNTRSLQNVGGGFGRENFTIGATHGPRAPDHEHHVADCLKPGRGNSHRRGCRHSAHLGGLDSRRDQQSTTRISHPHPSGYAAT
ncbi:MAG: hypothetical protein R2867_03970 [Caldilineaceae bacterium]